MRKINILITFSLIFCSGIYILLTGCVLDKGSTEIKITATDSNGGSSSPNNTVEGYTYGFKNTRTNYSMGNGATGIHVADINGDNYPDVVTANYYAHNISVRLNDSSNPGTFLAEATYAVGTNPNGVFLMDVNGDNYPDAISSNYGSHNVSVLLNNSGNPGTFLAQTTYSMGTNSYYTYVADINEDTYPDLVTANRGSSNVSVRLNNNGSPGTFLAATNYSVGSTPVYVVLADLNKDNHLDMIVTNRGSNTISVRYNDSGNLGTFLGETTYSMGSEPVSLSVIDVNGDTYLDVVTSNRGDDNMWIRLNDSGSPGALLAATSYSMGDYPSVFMADINGDGYPDATAGSYYDDNVSVRLNDGGNPGTFLSETTYSMGEGVAYIYVIDINSDNIPDVISANTDDDNISVRLGDSENRGKFETEITYSMGNYPDVYWGDINEDGYPDVVTGNYDDDTLTVRLNDSSNPGSLLSKTTYSMGGGSWSVQLIDINDDDHLDVITANEDVDTISIRLNNSASLGNFLAEQTYAMGDDPYNLRLADLNGDNLPDVATSNWYDDNIAIRLNNSGSPGTFLGITTYTMGNAPSSVFFGDINDDTYPDVLTANYYDDNISVRFNDSGNPGTFLAETTYSMGDTCSSVYLGDLNEDGYLDVVASNRVDDNISVRLNDSGNPGTFLAQATYYMGDKPNDVFLLDVNGDNHLDVITTNRDEDTVSVRLNDSENLGTFLAKSTYSVGIEPVMIHVIDVNDDGHPDIITGNDVTADISILINGI